jgi:hypothetical protein
VVRDVLGWDALPKGVEDFVENFMFFEGAGSSMVRPPAIQPLPRGPMRTCDPHASDRRHRVVRQENPAGF